MPIATLLIAVVVAGLWFPGGTAPQLRTGDAAISGTAVTLSSGQPIGEATVTIYAPAFPDGRRSTTTDDQGRFEFRDLVAGRYTVGASKTGFMNVVHGQRRPAGGGRAIPLRDGERRDIRLQLPRTSVVTGLVVDERGSPAVNASVRAVRFSLSFGYRRAESAGSATTDERGIYRLHSLQPGDYAICASTRSTGPLNEAQRLQMELDQLRKDVAFILGPEGAAAQQRVAPRLAALEARLPAQVDPVFGYGAVCHPGTVSLPSMIRVLPDEDRTGVDFQFALTRLARIEGVVIGMPREPAMDPIILMHADDTLGEAADVMRPDSEGRFRFPNVPPGRYRLIVRGRGDQSPVFRIGAAVDVVVAGEDIRRVILDAQPGATVTGQVVFRGNAPPDRAAVMARTMVSIEPAVPGALASRSSGHSIGSPDATGQFVVSTVFPGDYRISAGFREPAGWFVDSATLSGEDVLDQPLAIKPNQGISGVVVTLTDQRAELAGTILTEQGEPAPEYLILVYPTDERYWKAQSRRMFVTRARQDGAFVIAGLPSGDYRVATLLDAEPGAWFDPEFLRQLESTSKPLSITGPEKRLLHLRVPGGG